MGLFRIQLFRKYLIPGLLGAAATLVAAPSIGEGLAAKPAEERTSVTMACNDFPPHKIESSRVGLPGFDVEFLHEAFRRSGIRVVTPYYPWNRALLLAEQGQVDGLCSCSHRPEREDDFFYSNLVKDTLVGIFTLEDYEGPPITHLEQMRGLSIGVPLGYNLHDELRERGIQAITAKDDVLALRMLQAKRFQYLYSYRDTILFLAGRPGSPVKLRFFQIQNNPYYVCFSKKVADSETLLKLFNQGLREIREDGTYDRILEKYFVH